MNCFPFVLHVDYVGLEQGGASVSSSHETDRTNEMVSINQNYSALIALKSGLIFLNVFCIFSVRLSR